MCLPVVVRGMLKVDGCEIVVVRADKKNQRYNKFYMHPSLKFKNEYLLFKIFDLEYAGEKEGRKVFGRWHYLNNIRMKNFILDTQFLT